MADAPAHAVGDAGAEVDGASAAAVEADAAPTDGDGLNGTSGGALPATAVAGGVRGGSAAAEAESDDDIAASTASRVGALELSPNVAAAQPPATPATDERVSGASWDFSKATATDVQKNSKKEGE